MVGFGDLDVPVGGVQTQGRMLDQTDQDIDAQREIPAADDRDPLGRRRDLGLLLRAEAGRADEGDAALTLMDACSVFYTV